MKVFSCIVGRGYTVGFVGFSHISRLSCATDFNHYSFVLKWGYREWVAIKWISEAGIIQNIRVLISFLSLMCSVFLGQLARLKKIFLFTMFIFENRSRSRHLAARGSYISKKKSFIRKKMGQNLLPKKVLKIFRE